MPSRLAIPFTKCFRQINQLPSSQLARPDQRQQFRLLLMGFGLAFDDVRLHPLQFLGDEAGFLLDGGGLAV